MEVGLGVEVGFGSGVWPETWEGILKSTTIPGARPSSAAVPALTSTAYIAGSAERYTVSSSVGTPGCGVMVRMSTMRRSWSKNRMSKGIRVSFIQNARIDSSVKTNSIPASGSRWSRLESP